MSENKRAERCETCRWWNLSAAWDSGRETGFDGELESKCHRYPPMRSLQPDLDPADACYWDRPATYDTDWCGEWQPAKPVTTDVDNLGLAGLRLPCRAINCLESDGIDTIGKLRRCTVSKLHQIRNLGGATIVAIRERLAEHGLHLLGETPDKESNP